MDASDSESTRRRTRLAEIVELARTYRGWSRRELAQSLGRDATKLIPGSGIPKLDLVADLAGTLDWEVSDLVSTLCEDEPREAIEEGGPTSGATFDALDAACREAHQRGDSREMIRLARLARARATSSLERARSWNREAGGWDRLGRFRDALTAVRNGLRERDLPADIRRMLRSNLANAYYALWMLDEARGIALELLDGYAEEPPQGLRDRRTLAFAHYVAGNASRRALGEAASDGRSARLAERHLAAARDLYRAIGEETGEGSYAGIANTCEGALLEVSACTGRRSARDVVDLLLAGLDAVDGDLAACDGDWVESYGWWCIFGCNVALRGFDQEADVQRAMAVFTTKADEIAEYLDNWSIRERVFTMDHTRWERAIGAIGIDMPRVIDRDDVRIIAGTMARFPTFRDVGWRILRSARIVDEA